MFFWKTISAFFLLAISLAFGGSSVSIGAVGDSDVSVVPVKSGPQHQEDVFISKAPFLDDVIKSFPRTVRPKKNDETKQESEDISKNPLYIGLIAGGAVLVLVLVGVAVVVCTTRRKCSNKCRKDGGRVEQQKQREQYVKFSQQQSSVQPNVSPFSPGRDSDALTASADTLSYKSPPSAFQQRSSKSARERRFGREMSKLPGKITTSSGREISERDVVRPIPKSGRQASMSGSKSARETSKSTKEKLDAKPGSPLVSTKRSLTSSSPASSSNRTSVAKTSSPATSKSPRSSSKESSHKS